MATVPSSDYRIQLKEGTGFNSVLYSSDGTKPKYDATNPFELEVLYKPSGSNWINVSTSTKYNPQYTWNIKGTVYVRGWENPAWVETKLVRDYSSNTKPNLLLVFRAVYECCYLESKRDKTDEFVL